MPAASSSMRVPATSNTLLRRFCTSRAHSQWQKWFTGFCYALRRLSVVLFAESGGGPGNFKPEQIDPSSV
ncbi:MAG TPA: hypothetical protein VN617_03670 [Rhodoferax sp.]|nr:hypothetical protein [Rhodoferax sp.]